MQVKFLLAGAIALGAIAFANPAATAAEYEIIAGTQVKVGTPYDEGFKRFKELVEQKTGGRVVVNIFPNSQLGNESELFQAVTQGTVDMAVVAPGNIAEFVPQIAILEMPFMITSREQRDRVINGTPLQTISKLVTEKTGAEIVGIFGGGTRNMFFKEPAGKLADIVGRRFRTQASKQLTDSYGAIGLKPTVTSYKELYGALQQGVVEGGEMEAIYVEAASFPEVAPNFLMTRHVITIRPVLMSGKTLKKLPDDLRAAVLEAIREAAVYERGIEASEDQASLDRIKAKYGATFTEVDVTPMIEKIKPVWMKYAKEWGQEALLSEIDGMR